MSMITLSPSDPGWAAALTSLWRASAQTLVYPAPEDFVSAVTVGLQSMAQTAPSRTDLVAFWSGLREALGLQGYEIPAELLEAVEAAIGLPA